MITDELLERGLGEIGDGYDVPAHAIDDILDQLRPTEDIALSDEVVTTHRRWPPSRRTWLVSSAAALVVLIAVAFAVGGSGGGAPRTTVANSSGAEKTPVSAPNATAGKILDSRAVSAGSVPAIPDAYAQSRTQASGGGSTAPSALPLPTNDSLTKIVQTGDMDLQVDKGKVEATTAKLTDIATRLGGLVANSQSIGGDEPSASVTLRIPNAAFGKLLNEARGLGKVLSVNTKTANVTSQYVDLQARLHALGLTKSTYLSILTKASTIGEILSVQQRINDIQTQIDQLQGQLNVLTNQTTYATLTVSIDQKNTIKAAVVHHQSGISKAVHRSVSRFVHGVEAIIGVIGPIVLVLLLVGLGWLLARLGYRIVRRQMV